MSEAVIRGGRFWIVFVALAAGASVSSADAATRRFDRVQFQPFPGGHVNVVALNQAGQVTGTSGGMSMDQRQAFLSDSTGVLVNINTLGLSSSRATVISDAGHIAGTGCTTVNEVCQPVAFRYSAGSGMQNLGTPVGGKGADIAGVNVHGDVTGHWMVGEETTAQAFLFTTANGMQDLGSLGNGWTLPYAINDDRVIVGQSRFGTLPSHNHAFRWQAGTMTDLGTFGGVSSAATDINESGTIVGTALDATFNSHAFVFTAKNGLQPVPLPKDATSSSALAINEAGMILVAFMRADSTAGMAVAMPSGLVVDIPYLDGFSTGSAIAMNILGHVVGANVLVIGSEEIVSAFYWSEQTGTIQLDDTITNSLPWTIFNPVAINDADEIVVHGFDGPVEVSAFVRPALPGDVDGDRVVNIIDLLGVVSSWGQCPASGGCHADFDGGGVVNIADLLTVIANWG